MLIDYTSYSLNYSTYLNQWHHVQCGI